MVPVFILACLRRNSTALVNSRRWMRSLRRRPDADGRVPLPTDMAQMRSVRAETTPKTYLRSVTPDYAG